MGVVRMPFKGRRLVARLFRVDTDPNRARKAMDAAYETAGGLSPELKRLYREHVAAKKEREAKNQAV